MFIGTHENKVDRKGRVSVPASFRQVLAPQSFTGIVAFPSYRAPAIEACGMSFMERLNQSVAEVDLFSEQHDELALSIFAASHQLPFDVDGRVILPAELIETAGITDRAAFVGKGDMFQIWEPGALKQHLATARDRAREKGLTLSLRPKSGGAA